MAFHAAGTALVDKIREVLLAASVDINIFFTSSLRAVVEHNANFTPAVHVVFNGDGGKTSPTDSDTTVH